MRARMLETGKTREELMKEDFAAILDNYRAGCKRDSTCRRATYNEIKQDMEFCKKADNCSDKEYEKMKLELKEYE